VNWSTILQNLERLLVQWWWRHHQPQNPKNFRVTLKKGARMATATFSWDAITDPNTATLVLSCEDASDNQPFPPVTLSAPYPTQSVQTVTAPGNYTGTLTAYNAGGVPCANPPTAAFTVAPVPQTPADPTGFKVALS
jgi:hypothetical protein